MNLINGNSILSYIGIKYSAKIYKNYYRAGIIEIIHDNKDNCFLRSDNVQDVMVARVDSFEVPLVWDDKVAIYFTYSLSCRKSFLLSENLKKLSNIMLRNQHRIVIYSPIFLPFINYVYIFKEV
jgi:hypothetical protein